VNLEAQLIAGIIALFTALSTFAGGVINYLRNERKELKAEWAAEKEKYEAKLDVSANVILRQNEAMQKQIDAQSLLVAQQQKMIGVLQSIPKGPPA
jgi:hypothetical protein